MIPALGLGGKGCGLIVSLVTGPSNRLVLSLVGAVGLTEPEEDAGVGLGE